MEISDANMTTNAELADWIQRQLDDEYLAAPIVVSDAKWQQIIAALRHPELWKECYSCACPNKCARLKECQLGKPMTEPSSDKVLVPRVPTLAMLEAGRISQSFGDEELDLDDMRFKWNAMLDASEAEGHHE